MRLHRERKSLRREIARLGELGYVPFSKAGAELLFEVVSRAHERTSLIVTTNLAFESWTEVMDSSASRKLSWTGSPTASTSWRPMAKATACAKPEAD